MNEPSNFDTNIYSDKLHCPVNKYDDPPYETSQFHFRQSLFEMKFE